MPSQLLEVDQLRALSTYVKNIQEELQRHKELKGPILLAFTPRIANHSRAMSNWERKKDYLDNEVKKFAGYLEALEFAQRERDRVMAERAEKERMREGSVFTKDEDALEMA